MGALSFIDSPLTWEAMIPSSEDLSLSLSLSQCQVLDSVNSLNKSMALKELELNSLGPVFAF